MPENTTLVQLQREFAGSSFLAMPLAGMMAWTAAGLCGALLPEKQASFALFVCMGSIFPLGLLLARFTGEDLLGGRRKNELDQLFGLSILMANLGWGIAIPFWMVLPASLPLSAAILSGLMWIVFSWIIRHWVGYFHAIARTLMVAGAWLLFPRQRFVLIPAIVVALYAVTLVVLSRRERPPSAA